MMQEVVRIEIIIRTAEPLVAESLVAKPRSDPSIMDMLLSVRAEKVLNRLGVLRRSDFRKLTASILLSEKGCGRTTLREIRNAGGTYATNI